jgi:hypothetical protein
MGIDEREEYLIEAMQSPGENANPLLAALRLVLARKMEGVNGSILAYPRERRALCAQ